MSWVADLGLTVGGTLLAGLIAVEATGWCPRVTKYLLNCAVRRLPRRLRARYEEEWASHEAELPTMVSKLLFAVGVRFAAGRILKNERRRTRFARRRTQGSQLSRGLETYVRSLRQRLLADPEYRDWIANLRVMHKWKIKALGREEANAWLRRQMLFNSVTARALSRSFKAPKR
jgi:hypothetical protein